MQAGPGRPIPKSYFEQYEYATQFEAAERIADKWGITRDDCDRFGLQSQERAATAWQEGRFDREVLPLDAPDVDDDGKPAGHDAPRRPRRGPARDLARGAREAQARRP